jgi:hypothetical protein
VQSPPFTGVWTEAFLSRSSKSPWHSRQSLPLAPGFSFCALPEDAAGAATARLAARTAFEVDLVLALVGNGSTGAAVSSRVAMRVSVCAIIVRP